MKILSLRIVDNNDVVVRDIAFFENGLFHIYGNVKKPKNKKKTSNSIGKTLALKMCDYVLGCKCDSDLMNSKISDYKIIANINFNNTKYIVERKLNQKTIILDGEEITIQDYCAKFSLDRNYISRQVQLDSKGSLLGYNKNAAKVDYVSFLSLLNLTKLSNLVDEYYDLRTKIDSLEKTKNELLNINKITDDKLAEALFVNEKKLKEVNENILKDNQNIKTLEIGEDNAKLQAEYENINYELKKTQIEISKLLNEQKNLKAFIEESQNDGISIKSIKKMFDKANYEVPELTIRKLDEVEKFYKLVIEDRISNINNRIDAINVELNKYSDLKDEYVNTLDSIGRKISNDAIYQTAINSINENNNLLSNLKYEQGQLEQIKKVSDELSQSSDDIVKKHTIVKEMVNNSSKIINEYREFIFKIVTEIYSKDVTAFFSIYTSEYKKGAIPIHVDLNISGETGEGISEVKKNIIDILLFRYTSMCDLIILDSACFNGIDPRQVSGLLKVINDVCVKYNKQAIVSINKYQIDSDYQKFITEKNSIELSEDEKLLKISF